MTLQYFCFDCALSLTQSRVSARSAMGVALKATVATGLKVEPAQMTLNRSAVRLTAAIFCLFVLRVC